MSAFLANALQRLQQHYGHPGRWSARSPEEWVLVAILSHTGSPPGVERALANLREAGLHDVRALATLSREELAELIEPAGAKERNAQRIHNLLRMVVERFDASLAALLATDTETLREQLREVNGIGPALVDTIVLVAAQRPLLVVDRHLMRVLGRHGQMDYAADALSVQDALHGTLEPDAELYGELYRLVQRVGEEFCRKRSHCEGCPLQPLLEPGQPFEPSAEC